MEQSNKFSKAEKLKSKVAIDLLFEKGETINVYPIKLVFIEKSILNGVVANTGVSVPKRLIKLAVNRNLLKRRIREAYRLNNNELKSYLKKEGIEYNFMFVYNSKQILTYKEIETKIKVILTRLIELSEVVDN